MSKSIMIQGVGSNVGKSLVVAGLCRAFTRRGLNVRPFKPQNMSNNAAVTGDGGEIGRAQALQAQACGVEAHTDMNPVLLKPESETGAQVIVQGQRMYTVAARKYEHLKPKLLTAVLDSFARVKSACDLVIIEGAGSPAETNLRKGDIANMGFADAADIPVVLIGDIDRGGVIAQIVGTSAVMSHSDRKRIKGFIVNKFRGDIRLFDEGILDIARRTDWSALGVIPWFSAAASLPAEDILDIQPSRSGPIKIAVPQLSRIANFDDLDPLKQEPEVSVDIVAPGRALPGDADLILIPGTKSTIAELAFFRAQGWDVDLTAHIRRGGQVLGVCGGYQMLGRTIADPEGIEGVVGTVDGLGHLDVTTTMTQKKRLAKVTGKCCKSGTRFSGYEIHIGETHGPDSKNPWLTVEGQPHGAQTSGGQISGCYLHGLFGSDDFRGEYLSDLGAKNSGLNYGAQVEQVLDELATHLETHLDLDRLLAIATS